MGVPSHTMCLLTTNLVSWNSLSKSGSIAYTHAHQIAKIKSAKRDHGSEKIRKKSGQILK